MKKIFSAIISSPLKGRLCGLLFALLATTTLWAYDFQSGDLYYNITSSSAPYTVEVACEAPFSVNSYPDLTSTTIPETVTYNGITYNVTGIGWMAFFGCSSLTSIVIPNNVTSIGLRAFGDCSSLTSITIPNSVTSIGDWAFSYCDALTSIVVESGNSTYDSRENCNAIIETATNTLIAGCQNTAIPNSVTSIGEESFCGCSSLTSVTIPNSVTSIGEESFAYCTSLTSITIPNSVTNIGVIAFIGCSSLASIVVESSNNTYDSRNNCNAIIETATNTLILGCQNTVIPNAVTSIGNNAFRDCSSLTSITIPESVTSIEYNAFDGCSSLAYVTIPNSVTSIGDGAFWNCSSLTSITIPNAVTSIGNNAFRDCSSLTSITIPESVTSIGYNAFDGCSSLAYVTIPNSVTSIGRRAFGACSSLTSITIPNSVTSIEEETFFYCRSLTSVVIPNSVTSIGNSAFWNCSSLTSITIPNSVTSIGNSAFWNCSSLTSVTIPNNVTSIGDRAFGACSSLTSITIPNSVTNIGENAFEGCTFTRNNFINNSSLNAEENKYWGATIYEENGLCIVDSVVVDCLESVTSVIIPDTIIAIGDDAFDGCSSLTSIIIPNGVTTIGEFAFGECSSLKSITIPKSVTNIGISAFGECSSLKSITIPKSVTNIGIGAFAFCSSLTNMTVEVGNTIYDSRNNCNAIIETATNTLVVGCQNTVIPNSITSIGEYAFFYCDSLKSISIPHSVTDLGGGAFVGCSSLTSITIPNSVTSIGDYAFAECSSLDTIISLSMTPPALGEDVFLECNNPTLFVPCEALEVYQAHEQWGQFTDIQCIASEEVETDDVIITPSTTSVTITWPTAENAYKYIIQISKGSEIVCTLTFNMFGQLLNIQFVPSRTGAHHAQSATQTANGYCFNVTGLEENSTYTYNIITTDEADNTISTYSGEFTTQLNTPTDIENIGAQYPTSDVQKIMHNGQLLIIRDGKTYTVMGAEIK